MPTINGTARDDRLSGTFEDDLINGLGGSDGLDGSAGDDQIMGGEGNDGLDGGPGSDQLYGGVGNDSLGIFDGGGNEVLYGEAGNDSLSLLGAPASAILDGGDGDDEFYIRNFSGGQIGGRVFVICGSGNDHVTLLTPATITGGDGIDTVLIGYFTGGFGFTEAATTAIVTDFTAGVGGDVVDLYEYIVGSGSWNGSGSPFASGALRLVQYGADTAIETGSGTILILKNTNAPELVSENLGGFAPRGVTFVGTSEDEHFTGTSYNDQASGGGGRDVLFGGSGNDVLDGGTNADRLIGGSGDDTFYVQNTGDTIVEAANEGTDRVFASISYILAADVYAEALTLTGSSNIDGRGNGLANTLRGNSGNNVLNGGSGADKLYGGRGDDRYDVDNAGDKAFETSGEGTDTVFASVSYSLASQYIENLTLIGSENLNATGNTLDNLLTGNAGTNVLSGGKGHDVYYVQNDTDLIVEAKGEGTDIVYSTASFVLTSGVYVETLSLLGEANINATGNGIGNTLIGNAGTNVLTGGKGDDIYVIQDAADTVVEAKGEGTDLILSSVSFVMKAGSYVENLTLTGADNLNATGNGLGNTITGNAANNILDGGKGADALVGGKGDDTYYVDSNSDEVTEKIGQGTDLIISSASFEMKAGSYVENLTLTGSSNINATGNGVANVITGNARNNVLDGGKGGDSLRGGKGNDTYIVDNAADVVVEAKGEGADTVITTVSYTLQAGVYVESVILAGASNINATGNGAENDLTGNAGANVLDGGGAADVLIGGGGRDTLTGGSGADTFLFMALSDSVGATSDLLTDLTNNDFIDLSAIDGNASVAGVQGFSIVSAFSNAAGQLTLAYSAPNNTTTLNLDINGDGLADMTIRITGDHDDFTNFIFGGG